MSSTSYIGQSIKRLEDKRFITGRGKYTDDIKLVGMTYAHIIRSPYAHAKVVSIDTTNALNTEGVVAIFTGDNVKHIRGVPTGWQVNFKNGDIMKEPAHPLLVCVGETVKHVGDAVAVVIAESRSAARDIADLVYVEYEVFECVTNPKAAVQAGAPQVHGSPAPGAFSMLCASASITICIRI